MKSRDIGGSYTVGLFRKFMQFLSDILIKLELTDL